MPDAILFHGAPFDKRQNDQVRSAIGHEGYQLLREAIAANAVKLHVEALNAGVYSRTSEDAKAKVELLTEQAALYARALDVLDEMEKKPDQWFKAELKAGR